MAKKKATAGKPAIKRTIKPKKVVKLGIGAITSKSKMTRMPKYDCPGDCDHLTVGPPDPGMGHLIIVIY